jgi:large subunit ribosomal protein L24
MSQAASATRKPASAIKKNDTVKVISGRDRNKRGRVLNVIPEKGRLVVEGVNFLKKHTKANPQKGVKGGIVEREGALSASNVQLVCPECGEATRVGRKLLEDGRRVRYCVKCKGVVDK